MSGRRKHDGRGLADEDAELWRRVTRDTVPLPRSRARPTRSAPAPAPSAPEPAPASAKPARPARSAVRPALPAAPPARALEPGRAPGLDRRTADRLRRGQLPIDGRVDLHGMVQAEAHAALDAFIQDSAAAGRRCVLVITGRGARSAGGTGVLRAAVPGWLNGPSCRGRILAFAPARPQHGGEGALYVLLRRKRDRKTP